MVHKHQIIYIVCILIFTSCTFFNDEDEGKKKVIIERDMRLVGTWFINTGDTTTKHHYLRNFYLLKENGDADAEGLNDDGHYYSGSDWYTRGDSLLSLYAEYGSQGGDVYNRWFLLKYTFLNDSTVLIVDSIYDHKIDTTKETSIYYK